MTRILVAGIGNIFLGDDGFGSEVAQRLALRPQRAGVKVVDFGIRGFDLTYALLDGYHSAILIDVTHRGGPPGTLYVIEPSVGPGGAAPTIDMHGMHPERVMALVTAMGGELHGLRLVGCEPASMGADDDMRMGLSPAVTGAIEPAIALVESLIESLIANRGEDCAHA